jgi:hypothetical protein
VYKNQTVEWAQATSADWATEQTHTITIPPGNYNLSDLELQIARELLETNDGSATCIWGRMNAMAQEIKAHHELSPSADGMTVAAGVANPNVPGQFSNDSSNPPLQFHELIEIVSATSKVNIVLSGRHKLGSAVAPKIPYSQLDPTKGQVTRMWHDFTAAAGRPLGMRAGCQSLSQYCGWDNSNGPSGACATV